MFLGVLILLVLEILSEGSASAHREYRTWLARLFGIEMPDEALGLPAIGPGQKAEPNRNGSNRSHFTTVNLVSPKTKPSSVIRAM